MKRSKPINSATNSSSRPPREISTRAQLRELQRVMAAALFRPLTPQWGMQKRWTDGSRMHDVAAEFIKPNDRLSSFERFLKKEPQWSAPRQELARDMVRFEWAQVVAFDGPAKPPVTPDDILDTPPSKLRLDLQPYLSLLELDYAVDDFLIAVKKRESDVLRGEASNAVQSAPKTAKRRKRIRPPKREKVYLGVHRHDNMLYYKRLDPEAFAILTALGRGTTVEAPRR